MVKSNDFTSTVINNELSDREKAVDDSKYDLDDVRNVVKQNIELRMLIDVPYYLDEDGKLIKHKTNFVVDKSYNVYDYDEYNGIDINGEPKRKLKIIGELIVYDGDENEQLKGRRMVKLGFL